MDDHVPMATQPLPPSRLYSAEFFADPYSYYAHLREHEPVRWDGDFQFWLVSRYADVSRVIKEPDRFSARLSLETGPPSPPIRDEDRAAHDCLMRYRSDEFIQQDPPLHTEKRRPVAPRFSTQSLEALRPFVRDAVRGLLDRVADQGGMDVRAAVGLPLPMLMIAKIMGVEGDSALIAEQARRRMASVLSLAEDRMETAMRGFDETARYLEGRLDEAGAATRDDILGDLARAERSQAYSRGEALANAMLLIDAGHETTVQLICNATLSLLRHPDQWEMLTTDPGRWSRPAIEEALRFDPPLHAIRRVAVSEVELNGRAIAPGDRIVGLIASANRDPEQFHDPERFLIARQPNRHLSFGMANHYCLGQYLARMEGQEYLTVIAERFPKLRPAGGADISYFHAPRVRSVTALRVAWE